MKTIKDCRLYAILDSAYLGNRNPGKVTEEMIRGGVDVIQIRAKTASHDVIRKMAEEVLPRTRKAGIPLIINDHPKIAVEVGADGIHVGQDDLPIKEVRKIVGPGMIIGKSTHSLEQAIAGSAEDVDYIGVGPIFATPTKPDYKQVGLDLITQVKEKVELPFFCIGGIKLENAPQVISYGADRFVVVSGILQAPDIAEYCRKLNSILETKSHKSRAL